MQHFGEEGPGYSHVVAVPTKKSKYIDIKGSAVPGYQGYIPGKVQNFLAWVLPVRAVPGPVHRYTVNGVQVLTVYRYTGNPNIGMSVLGCIEADGSKDSFSSIARI